MKLYILKINRKKINENLFSVTLIFGDHCIKISCVTVKPLITNTSKEFIKCRILHFLIMECCRYLVF